MLRFGGQPAIVAACALIGSLAPAGVAYADTPTPSPLAVPAAPSNLRWDNGFGPPGLHWTSHSANEDGFRRQRMTAAGWLTIATYPAGATSGQSPVFSHDDYCDNVQIVLVAFDSAGESVPRTRSSYRPYHRAAAVLRPRPTSTTLARWLTHSQSIVCLGRR